MFSGINKFFFKELNGIQCKTLAEAAKDETTHFKSVGAKVQVQMLKIKQICNKSKREKI